MHSSPLRRGTAGRFILVLLLIFVATGCEEMKTRKKILTFTCGNHAVKVNTTNGAQPQAVYVCDDDTVTWDADGHTFVVEFKNDSPFEDGGKKFDNAHPNSGKSKHHTQLTVYEYRITVDTNHVFDPQVIGGGG